MNNNLQKTKLPFQTFNNFVFRTPLYSYQHFKKAINLLNENKSYWLEFLRDNLLQEAIFLASPNLYNEICKFLDNKITESKEIEQLKMSVMRYFTRMCTRCTPFGLFAGISMGEISDNTSIILSDISKYQRFTRLDMNFLCELAINLSKLDNLRNKLKYYPNNSLYKVGEKYRYVEYYFIKTKRFNKISAFDFSKYLHNLFEHSASGARINELVPLLIDDEITYNEAKEFIVELIENQILISELEPNITGEDLFLRIIKVLKSYELSEKYNLLEDIGLKLKISDKSVLKKDADITLYNSIIETIGKTGVEYDPKFLFQCDMYKPVKNAELSGAITDAIKETLRFLNKLCLPPSETMLTKFIADFIERYETMEVPLLLVMDNEMGLGYNTNHGDSNPLIDDIITSNTSKANTYEIKWNRIQSILLNKLVNCKANNLFQIELTDNDFDFLDTKNNDLPNTLSAIVKILSYKDEHNFLICCKGAGGPSAANLLGRFCYLNKNITRHVLDITQYEQHKQPEAIHAEIVHLPESRIGNILFRPILRPYEIVYLAKSGVDDEFQIALSDLFVSVNNGRLILRSKKHNKEIVPHLSTAHNYSLNAMPVYHFLCDLQFHNKRNGLGFEWGNLENEFDFLPRVTYKNVIISLATWRIKLDDLNKVIFGEIKPKQANLSITQNSMEQLTSWRKNKMIPDYVVLSDGDNQLFIDFTNLLSINILLSVIKKRSMFTIEEFPFDFNNSIIKDSLGNTYVNEFIFSLF